MEKILPSRSVQSPTAWSVRVASTDFASNTVAGCVYLCQKSIPPLQIFVLRTVKDLVAVICFPLSIFFLKFTD
jgi:hypothetical protein